MLFVKVEISGANTKEGRTRVRIGCVLVEMLWCKDRTTPRASRVRLAFMQAHNSSRNLVRMAKFEHDD